MEQIVSKIIWFADSVRSPLGIPYVQRKVENDKRVKNWKWLYGRADIWQMGWTQQALSKKNKWYVFIPLSPREEKALSFRLSRSVFSLTLALSVLRASEEGLNVGVYRETTSSHPLIFRRIPFQTGPSTKLLNSLSNSHSYLYSTIF